MSAAFSAVSKLIVQTQCSTRRTPSTGSQDQTQHVWRIASIPVSMASPVVHLQQRRVPSPPSRLKRGMEDLQPHPLPLKLPQQRARVAPRRMEPTLLRLVLSRLRRLRAPTRSISLRSRQSSRSGSTTPYVWLLWSSNSRLHTFFDNSVSCAPTLFRRSRSAEPGWASMCTEANSFGSSWFRTMSSSWRPKITRVGTKYSLSWT